MFDHTHYVPILKSKAGELLALENTTRKVREKFCPLFEISPIPLKWPDKVGEEPELAKSIDEHVALQIKAIATSWSPELPCFIDTVHIADYTLDGGVEPLEGVLSGLKSAGLEPIPVVGIDSYMEHVDAAKAFAAAEDCGACLRLTSRDLENVDTFGDEVEAFLKHIKLAAGEVDLVIDYGGIQSEIVSTLKAAVPLQLAVIPKLEQWRSLTIAGTGMPENLSEIEQYSIDEIDRSEWELWLHIRRLHGRLKRKRVPTFGDYAITHPAVLELDPRLMRMSPKIKYTSELSWVVAKGEAYRRKKDPIKSTPGSVQYPKLAEAIMEHDAWRDRDFSWGDAYIADCAEKKCVGGMKEWVAVGTAHHLACVVKQLANLRAI